MNDVRRRMDEMQRERWSEMIKPLLWASCLSLLCLLIAVVLVASLMFFGG